MFEEYWELLHNIVFNRLKSSDVADDLVQDVFADIWKNRQSLKIKTSLKAYLCQSVKYRVYNHIRHQSVRQKTEYVELIYDQYYSRPSEVSADNQLACREIERIIDREIKKMPEKSRKMYQFSRVKNYSNQEIADHFGCSKKNVEYHLTKVLSSLKLRLNNYLA